MYLVIFQRLAFQFFLDIIMFPVWWYTSGLWKVLVVLYHSFDDARISLAPGLWMKHVFTPMFGQRDLEGRLMSIFMRIVNIIGRSLMLFIWIWILVFFACVWLVLPVLLVYLIIRPFVFV